MKATKEMAAEAAHGWSDTAGEWLTEVVGQRLSGLEAFMSPEMLANLSKAIATFIFIFTELTLLFLLISFTIGILQSYIPPEKIQKMLSRKRGYVMAALLGAITPFCSCSTIPFLKGLIRAGAGFGGIIVFLLASPLLNPIIIGLFSISFGLKVAVYYFAVAMIFSILAGIILEKLGFEKYIRTASDNAETACGCGSDNPAPVESCGCDAEKPQAQDGSCCTAPSASAGTGRFGGNCRLAWRQAVVDFRQAFVFMLLGVVIGSVIYGFVPDSFISKYAGGESPWSIPVAAVVGVPLYIRAEAVIPISLGLVAKGMSLGAVMAFIIGSAGASLTEVVMLKALFKNQIIVAFLIVVFTMAILAGFLMPIVL